MLADAFAPPLCASGSPIGGQRNIAAHDKIVGEMLGREGEKR